MKKLSSKLNISYTKTSLITGVVLSVLLLIVLILDYKAYLWVDFRCNELLFTGCILLSVIIGAIVAFKIEIINERARNIVNVLIALLLPVVTITMAECLNNVFVYDMTYYGFCYTYILLVLISAVIYAVSGSIRLPVFILNPLIYVMAVISYFLLAFRGSPLVPMDILSIQTGMNVMSEYNFRPTYKVVTGLVLMIFTLVVAIRIKTPKLKKKIKIISRTSCASVFLTVMMLFYFTNMPAALDITPDFWNQARGYNRSGFILGFFENTRYLYVLEPKGYDAEKVDGYIAEFADRYEEKAKDQVVSESPNIICIMNESLADLSVLGDFETNKDYMPFIRSLGENTVKGNLYVPVIGAGTSNTEYEFLTGNTTAFFPPGSNAYMLYVDGTAPSLVSTLEDSGYYSEAFHPYRANGWNRPNVYESFGFNVFKSLESMFDMNIFKKYQASGNNLNYLEHLLEREYGSSDILIRQYVSDSYNYKYLIEDYENHLGSNPFFVFNVTMQNHGGYSKGAPNLDEDIRVLNSSENLSKVNRYLSLVKRSDEAFEELINYFSDVEEPTIICMFGDHHPSVDSDFMASLLGKSLSDLSVEEQQLRYATPFIIWANYDINEEYIERLSSNYLSSYLLEIAGLPLTEYNKYLLSLSKVLPVINTVGIIDKDGMHYGWDEENLYQDILNKYELIQYNQVFDKKNLREDNFYLN